MSENVKYIQVRMVTHRLGNGEYCSVRFPGTDWVMPIAYSDLRDAPDDERMRAALDSWRGHARKWRDERDALRDRVAELERERDQYRRESEERRTERNGLRSRVDDLERLLGQRDDLLLQRGKQRDEARRQTKSVSQALSEAARQRDAAEDQLDEARREAEDLGARCRELEARADALETEAKKARDAEGEMLGEVARLRKPRVSACPECGSSLCFDPRYGQLRWADPTDAEPDQPAPQTHFRENDLVLGHVSGNEYRLEAFVSFANDGAERWRDAYDWVAVWPGHCLVLERDGIPTDEGLRRLAEKAGYRFTHIEEPVAGTSGYSLDDGIPHSRSATATLYGESDKYRRRLADTLREMGGA